MTTPSNADGDFDHSQAFVNQLLSRCLHLAHAERLKVWGQWPPSKDTPTIDDSDCYRYASILSAKLLELAVALETTTNNNSGSAQERRQCDLASDAPHDHPLRRFSRATLHDMLDDFALVVNEELQHVAVRVLDAHVAQIRQMEKAALFHAPEQLLLAALFNRAIDRQREDTKSPIYRSSPVAQHFHSDLFYDETLQFGRVDDVSRAERGLQSFATVLVHQLYRISYQLGRQADELLLSSNEAQRKADDAERSVAIDSDSDDQSDLLFDTADSRLLLKTSSEKLADFIIGDTLYRAFSNLESTGEFL